MADGTSIHVGAVEARSMKCRSCRDRSCYPSRTPGDAVYVIGVDPAQGRTWICRRCALELAFKILDLEFGGG